MMGGVALGTLQDNIRDWLDSKVRVDGWTVDNPVNVGTYINQTPYPSNASVVLPPRRISYEESPFGMMGQAQLGFKIEYRFHKSLKYDDLPIAPLANLLNNVYFSAVTQPQDINSNIRSLSTPDDGVDMSVGRLGDTDADWIVTLKIDFYVTFKAALGSLDGIQPGDDDNSPVIVNRIDIGVHRAAIGNFEDARLDRIITITRPDVNP
jgi:hypothetical protein